MSDETQEQKWVCAWCDNDDIWFDRTIAYLPDGTEIGMKDRCTRCGKATDELPEIDLDSAEEDTNKTVILDQEGNLIGGCTDACDDGGCGCGE